MPSYLVETYLPRSGATGPDDRDGHARRAALELTARGIPVRFERSITVPADEVCLLVFDAASDAAALLAARRAGLEPLRVVEAVQSARSDP